MFKIKSNKLISQTLMNFIPFLGVFFWNWSVFTLVFAFCLKTWAFVFFNGIKILFAQKGENKPLHLVKYFIYVAFNSCLLFFYLIFIIVFIGFLIGNHQEGTNYINTLKLTDPRLRYTILVFFIYKFGELIFEYFLNGVYKNSNPDSINQIFNPRLLYLHLVIVVGFFSFLSFSKIFNNQIGIYAFAFVFTALKLILDFNTIIKENNQVYL